jgi:hypothetical protein
LEKQPGWLEQRRGWLVEQRICIEQRRGWLTQQGDKLTQQEVWLIQQEAWLDQQHMALVQQYSEVVQLEGTHSQAVRTMGLRRSRSIGLRKTHLGHVAVAAAANVIQLMSWLRGEAPEQTRTSPFKRVMKPTVPKPSNTLKHKL